MASSTISKPTGSVIVTNNELIEVNTVYTPNITENDIVLITLSRYGRACGTVVTGTMLFTAVQGIVIPISSTDTVTLTSNGTNGFTITSNNSGYPSFYVTIVKLMT